MATHLADGSITQTSDIYITPSVKMAANSLILAWITNAKDGPLLTPTLASNGLTWVQVATAWYGTISNPTHRITLFRAMGPSATDSPITISFPATQRNVAWSIVQFSGVDVSGTNGSSGILQVATNALDSSTVEVGLSISLGSLSNLANATAGGFSNSMSWDKPIISALGFERSPGTYTGSPNSYAMSEWAVPGKTAVNVTQTNSAHIAGIAVEIKAGPTPILQSGPDPPGANIGPGGAPTVVDLFTLHVTEGASALSSVTVTMLPAGSSGGLSKVEIIDEAGTVYGFADNPGDVTPITLTRQIVATTTVSTYKIRITPKSHAAMPAPAGSTYNVTANISGTSGNTGSDSGNTVVTVDNQSPANVTSLNASLGDRQTPLSWSNPPDADLGSIVVLRKEGSAVADTPVEGATYAVGDTIGASTVACVVASPGASCTDTGLTNNTTYYYRVFARDTNGNYSTTAGVAVGSATPNRFTPDLMIKTSDASDSYLADNIYETTATAQVKALGVLTGVTAVYKVTMGNDGTAADRLIIKAAPTGSNFTAQYLDESSNDRTAEVTSLSGLLTPSLAVGESREWTVKVTPNSSGTPVPGGTSCELRLTATSNSDATKHDQVKAVTTSTSANITLLQSADKSSCQPGEEITYSIVASNGASLSAASGVEVIYPVPATTGLKVGSAAFSPGSSTLTTAVKYYYDGSWEYLPQSGRCSAPAGYDYCVRQVKWLTSGSMPTSTNFTCTMVVRVK